MPIEIYGMPLSAPCRILNLTCEVLGLEYKETFVDYMKGEHKSPEYLKINPLHTIPTMKDGDFVMTESRAGAAYLVNQYAKDDKLYPKEVKQRAIVDQRLYFDMDVFFKAFGDCVFPLMLKKTGTVGQDKKDRFVEVMGWVRDYIKPTGYVAGTNHLTLADICFVATFSTVLATENFDVSAFPEVTAWFNKIKAEIPNYEKANGKGATEFGNLFKADQA